MAQQPPNPPDLSAEQIPAYPVPETTEQAIPKKRRPGNPNVAKEGEPYRWKKGQSGNPGGRPKIKPFSDRARWLAEQPVPEKIRIKLGLAEGSTFADAAVVAQFVAAMAGDSGPFQNLRDTTEGRLAFTVNTSDRVDKLKEMIASTDEMARQLKLAITKKD